MDQKKLFAGALAFGLSVSLLGGSALPISAAQTNVYTDGVYTGSASCSYGYNVSAVVNIANNAVSSVELSTDNTSSRNTSYIDRAISEMNTAYIGKTIVDSVEVDTVSGATAVSKAVNEAVASALSQSVGSTGSDSDATGSDATSGATTVEDSSDSTSSTTAFADGTYSASETVSGGKVKKTYTVTVSMSIHNGTVSSCSITHTASKSDDKKRAESAKKKLSGKYVGLTYDTYANTSVDVVSGATITSSAIITAAKNALAKAVNEGTTGSAAGDTTDSKTDTTSGATTKEDSTKTDTTSGATTKTETTTTTGKYFADGTYKATRKVSGGSVKKAYTVTVEFEIKKGKIDDCDIDDTASKSADEKRAKAARKALEDVYEDMTYSTYSGKTIDTVSGATITSNAIISAADEALGKAVKEK